METTIPKLLRRIATDHPNQSAQMQKDEKEEFQTTTFKELYNQVHHFAFGLQSLGVKRGDRIGLISDNRQEWLVADLAIQSLGASDIPRGCDSNADEIAYILSFSQCTLTILENKRQLEKVVEKEKELPGLKEVIILDPRFEMTKNAFGRFKVHKYKDILGKGAGKDLSPIDKEIDKGTTDEIATIIYTSGTTGQPKGVMLTHKNFLHQVKFAPVLISVGPGDRWLSVLPVWHAFERIMQYIALGTASTLCYSQPVGSILLADMGKVHPTWMASVPRIWEAVREGIYRNVNQAGGIKRALFLFFVAVGSAWKTCFNLIMGWFPRFNRRSRVVDFLMGILPVIFLWPLKALGSVLVFKTIKAKLGGRFVAGISGGGGLPAHVDAFFQAAGILLLEGYGLTESAPVLSLRLEKHPVPGTIGPAFPRTELKIIGKDGSELGPNQVGILHARGPQIMKGYYRMEDLTAQVIDKEGFLNTGDLSIKTYDGEYAIVGRAKDTIVLLGGENVEPAPIETKLKLSPYISTAVLIGQDKKYLSALILADQDSVKAWAEENKIFYDQDADLFAGPEVHQLIGAEIAALISSKTGFKGFERILRFTLLPKPFEVGRELSAKQEIKRHAINTIYSSQIKKLYS